MTDKLSNLHLESWSNELHHSILRNDAMLIAVFSTKKEILFINNTFLKFANNDIINSFVNPTFENLLSMEHTNQPIFDGYITFGDYASINKSIVAQVFRKNDQFLLIGNINTSQLFEQNENMHHLNREISNLQRQLIKEKSALENTLEQLNTVNTQLDALNKSKDRFINILAHDLRNPLVTICGFLNRLSKNLKEYDIDKVDRQLKIVNESAIATTKLVENLLFWERLQVKQFTFDIKNHSILEASNSTIEIIKLQAVNKKVKLVNKIKPDLFSNFDINIFDIVLRNLLSNALKFTNTHGEISIDCVEENSNYVIIVSDNGVGMTADQLYKLFTISDKNTSLGTDNEKGTGLGLLICKELVDKHNGKIWAESSLGIGSKFKFYLK